MTKLAQETLNQGAFEWCLRNADASLAQKDLDSAAAWLGIAAEAASEFAPFSLFASRELERLLCQLAAKLARPALTERSHPPRRWMHVVTEVYAVYGHSINLRRWIERDDPSSVHSVVATGQSAAFPDALRDAVVHTGGRVVCLDKGLSEMRRATALRDLAWSEADVVVLHTHPRDVVPVIAMGVGGGPPVLLVNHADHLFWPGSSIADVVVSIRASGSALAEQHRGIIAGAVLPIPPPDATLDQAALIPDRRARARNALSIPTDAIVYLTVGQHYKFEPAPGMDFYAAAEQILLANANAYVIAVGPKPSLRTTAIADATNGRFRAVGTQHDLSNYQSAADVYLEGFPIGSLTSLLEASLAGLPCVRSPALVPPTMCADGEALDAQPRPADVSQYVKEAIYLGSVDAPVRQKLAAALTSAVEAVHTGAGWRSRLEALKARIPAQHASPRQIVATSIPGNHLDFWMNAIHAFPRPTLELVAECALARSLPFRAPIGANLWTSALRVDHSAASRSLLRWDRRMPLVGKIGQNLRSRQFEAQRLETLALRVWNFGDCSAARRALLRCFAVNPTRIAVAKLLIIFLKSLLGQRLLGVLRHLRHERNHTVGVRSASAE